ncbi:MAG: homoserine dehydrogenase [Elusimicrobia bacterium]|nr:homoserine dehydrogenase [Elusimicrobiota bacterium]
MQKRKVNLGFVGLGTVGSCTLEILNKNSKIIESKIGTSIEVTHLCDASSSRLKAGAKRLGSNVKLSSDWQKLVTDSNVDIVVELIGGIDIAKKVIIESLKNGKNVVTANKAVLAENWDEIFTLARSKRKVVYFEATVGAGIPIIQALNEGLASNRINCIAGILNGTTNYILTRMFKENISFDIALKQAQKSGFAEVNPHFDIEGIDTTHKLSILSSIAWSCWVKKEKIYCEGIGNIDRIDIKYAYEEFGYIIKLLGVGRNCGNKLDFYVSPCLIPKDHPFAAVENEYNAILVDGNASGNIMFYGKGAGGNPAASAVVSDIMFLAKEFSMGTAGTVPYVNTSNCAALEYLPARDRTGKYYLRFSAIDKPGVLSKISGMLAKYNVSIAQVFQKEPVSRHKKVVPVLIITHSVKEKAIRDAIDEINKLSVIKSKAVLIRIEDLSV